jgi:hypothetical protein
MIHTYTHKYIHTYLHTYIHTHTRTFHEPMCVTKVPNLMSLFGWLGRTKVSVLVRGLNFQTIVKKKDFWNLILMLILSSYAPKNFIHNQSPPSK